MVHAACPILGRRGGHGTIRGILPVLCATVAAAAAAPEAPAPVARVEVEAALAKAGPAVSPARPLRIVLLADRKDHGPGAHDYPAWQEGWSKLLGRAAGVTVETATGWPADAQFESADAIAAFCYLAWTDARKAQVRSFLDRGGGLVLIHSATWTKPKADASVGELVGVGGFTRFRHGEVRMETVAPGHPVCAGLPPVVVLHDETYWPPTPVPVAGSIRVLAVSREADGAGAEPVAQPVFWTREAGRGRVFGCVPGHFMWTFDDPWFRLWLLRGMAWAGGGDARRLDPLALDGARVR